MNEETKTSPMMAQWQACKEMAPNAILLFRLGDFYEAFHDDAHILSRELDLTLTKRQEVPMSGVPYHSADAYIDKLVSKGFRVAIAEQTEDPKKTKGIVKREVVRVVTPGTVINSSLLSEKSNNYFAALSKAGKIYGLAFLDLTTGAFWVSEFLEEKELLNELYRLKPSELLSTEKLKDSLPHLFKELNLHFSCLVNTIEEWHFDHRLTYDYLVEHFKVHSLEGFGLTGMTAAINAGGALLHYLESSLCLCVDHINEIHPYSSKNYLLLDRASQRNLELTESLHDGSRKNTLIQVLDRTSTPMGARLLNSWLKQPLISVDGINNRQEGVQTFYNDPEASENLKALLQPVRDLERIMMKVCTGYASPRDLIALAISYEPVIHIKSLLASIPSTYIQKALSRIEPLPAMIQHIQRALEDEPPLRLGEGKVFREGYNKEIDDLREISRDSKAWIARYQIQLREQTGIKTLKVGYNRMFGYYIEVSRGQSDRMPESFMRRQTLVNAERFITPELKDYESKVLTAEERIGAIESELFNQLRMDIAQYSKAVLATAHALAQIDCIRSLAEVALERNYSRPEINEGHALVIEEGRHPVIESSFHQEKFIPNDTLINDEEQRLLLITGPNMAGKSTYLRQVALIVIMAQMGSFIPARSARIGIVDQVFTRIGASDDLTRGQSTFMVEMTETANILNNATQRSLVILDEIGRGTSTYDGISIAWAVAEFLLTTPGKTTKTLFATHYWELTKLEGKIPGAVNFHVAVHEADDHITFLRKIIPGGTDKSYGIHVGRLAGLPHAVIVRAHEILAHLEENSNRKNAFEPPRPKRAPASKIKIPHSNLQMTLFE